MSINYKYCPQCRKKLARDKEGNPYCKKCQITIYNNPAPTVGILPIKGGEVLLARRAIEPHKGKLDTIGGFLNNGELPEAAARREAKEETGLVPDITEFLGFYADIYEANKHTLSLNYVARLKDSDAKPQPSDDVAALQWVSINNPPLQDVGFKNTIMVLEMLKEWYQKSKSN